MKALQANYDNVKNFELDGSLTQQLTAFAPDVVFPILHGSPGEDGTLQGYLEIMGLKYVGSDVKSSAVAMDKVIAKHVYGAAGLPLAKQVVVQKDDGISTCVEKIRQLGSAVVVKPSGQGSALGVTLVDNENQLAAALEKAFALNHCVLVEERIYGTEMTVGVLETADGIEALPVIEITTPENSWYDYEHRYTVGLSGHIIPAPISDEQTRRLQKIAIEAHQSVGCRDLSRADFVVPDGDSEILLEVNTLPGMTPTSLYPDAAAHVGYSFESLVSILVEQAAAR